MDKERRLLVGTAVALVGAVAPVIALSGLSGETGFAAVRLTGGASRRLRRAGRLFTHVVIRFPNGTRELLGDETLLRPAGRQARYRAGPLPLPAGRAFLRPERMEVTACDSGCPRFERIINLAT